MTKPPIAASERRRAEQQPATSSDTPIAASAATAPAIASRAASARGARTRASAAAALTVVVLTRVIVHRMCDVWHDGGFAVAARPDRRPSQARKRPSVRSTAIGRPNASLRTGPVRTAADRPGGDRPPAAEDEGMAEPGRDLLDVVGDEDDRPWRGAGREPPEVPDERLARAEVEAGAGLVEDQQVGVRHQRPGDLDPAALAGRERPERAVGERRRADSSRSRAARSRSASVNSCHHGPSAA